MSVGFSIGPNGSVSRLIAKTLYNAASIETASMAFAEHCHVQIEQLDDDHLLVSLSPNDAQNVRNCVLAFWNFVLSTEAEGRIG
jgi:hypothetical protein